MHWYGVEGKKQGRVGPVGIYKQEGNVGLTDTVDATGQ